MLFNWHLRNLLDPLLFLDIAIWLMTYCIILVIFFSFFFFFANVELLWTHCYIECTHTHILNAYTYGTMDACSGNSQSFILQVHYLPHTSPESVPTHVTELRRQPLRVGPESPSNIGYQSINGGENGPCHLLGYVLPPTISKLKLSFATLSVRTLHQAVLCAKGWDAIRHWLWKASKPFVFDRSPVHNEVLKRSYLAFLS